ncbi:hypothetical protein KI387_034154, partial [Taxus chinensis]
VVLPSSSNPKLKQVSLPSSSNPKLKQASRPKQEIEDKIRVPEAKSLPRDVPGLPSPNTPEIRMPIKSAVDTSPRQFPKSPLASLFVKNQVKGNEVNILPVTVNVLGSAGPMRFLASYADPVQKVMETALKSYARGGRLPVLGLNTKQFELHCANSGCGQALDSFEIIGELGTRNFLLCKKLEQEEERDIDRDHQKTNIWKNWLNT